MKERWGRWTTQLVLLWLLCASAAGHANDRSYANCAVAAVAALSFLGGRSLEAADLRQVSAVQPAATATMLDARAMCAAVGLQVTPTRWTVEDFERCSRPTLIALRNPDHFTVLLDVQPLGARLMDSPVDGPTLYPWSELQPRLVGLVLVPDYDGGPDADGDVWTNRVIDVGGMTAATATATAVKIENRGEIPLDVSVLRSTCGCTVPVPLEAPVPPGGHATMEVLLIPDAPGPFEQHVFLETSSPSLPVVAVSFVGVATAHASSFTPSVVSIQSVHGQGAQNAVDLMGPPDLIVRDMPSSNPHLEAVVTRSIRTETSSQHHIELRLDPEAPVGDHTAWMEVESSQKAAANIRPLEVRISVRPIVEISPRLLFLGDVRVGSMARSVVLLDTELDLDLTGRIGLLTENMNVRIVRRSVDGGKAKCEIEMSIHKLGLIDERVLLTYRGKVIPGAEVRVVAWAHEE
ncbi:MAG TPA: hypothetical protein DCZ72_04980 [Armatimonadetes bacterium]|nr:hypothetical protein [Armatimonadota bacterium]